jgi:hypothetical protein
MNLKMTTLEQVFKKAGIIFCHQCGQGYTDEKNIEAIKKLGECLSCDHVRGDILQDTYDLRDLPF